jgi:hypothetical protein
VQVTGLIRAFQTKAPVAAAQVQVGSSVATTDVAGTYRLTVAAGEHAISVADEALGTFRLNERTFRGDFYVHNTGCVARYGSVVDRDTRRPIAGAAVTVGGGSATTDQAGWYEVALGCSATCIGFNTTFLYIAHPNYADGRFVAGRGVCFVSRRDYELVRK